MLDYAVASGDALEGLEELKVLEEVGSDHLPIRIKWKGKRLYKVRKMETKEAWDWSEEGVKSFRKNLRESEVKAKSWSELKEKIEKAMVKKEIKIKIGSVSEKWWYEQCFEKKQSYKKALSEWRSSNEGEKERKFKKSRREYKEQVSKSKKEYGDRVIMELNRSKGLCEYWDIINRC